MVRICYTTSLLATVVMMAAVVVVTEAREPGSNEGEARYIYVNTESPMTIAVLLNVPLSLALPIIARHEHYHSSYEGRHLPPLLPDTSTSQHHYEYSSRDQDDVLHDDLHYFTETTKLASYFAYLKVVDAPCQERLLCELASDPPAFFPASDIFLKELRPQHGDVEEDDHSRFWRYVRAARGGAEGDPAGCRARHPACPVAIGEVLSMTALRFWQLLAQIVDISFTDY
ncbi:LOW QUALITY PROTEIN: uncharacterized protein LOC123520478 [Portunus trituberculatus]|uniref:LOW QUALITY PROTEIN: uncharacterized protein LOC123520478 n=1 Tax=Portunus trituberculatus TaxID=210409 RepID=UPI001E1D1E41|nr:LOW QUALITY PROTEIN: uncharacterized protein LOC123520478 [Portunus trituberculatus]